MGVFLSLLPDFFVLTGNKSFVCHRMVKIDRDRWRSSHPYTLLKQGHLELVAQNSVQMAFK